MKRNPVYTIEASLSTLDTEYKQVDHENGIRHPTNKIFNDVESCIFYMNLIGIAFSKKGAKIIIAGDCDENRNLYIKYTNAHKCQVSIQLYVKKIDVLGLYETITSDYSEIDEIISDYAPNGIIEEPK